VTHAGTRLDSRSLRRALGLYTTGVTVITTRTPDGAHTGLTVNSFTSSRSTAARAVLPRHAIEPVVDVRARSALCRNVLAKGQQGLSNRFAKPSVNTWEDVKFELVIGCALLDGVGTLSASRTGVPAAII
jgi:flavin reductase (DIM6/NTAB) family NADH-FMN oxidoreductase RutF